MNTVNNIENNTIMIHLSSKKFNINDLDYYLKIFKKQNIKFSILVRDLVSLKKLKKIYPKLQIFFAKTPIDVEDIITSQTHLKIVFHPINTAKNLHLLRFNHLYHIYINFKSLNYKFDIDKTFRAYDEFWILSNNQSNNNSNNNTLINSIDFRHLKFYKIYLEKTFIENIKRLESLKTV